MTEEEIVFERIWHGFYCSPDGSPNIEAIKRDLSASLEAAVQVGRVYCELTNGLLSEGHYPAETVITIVQDLQNADTREAVFEATQKARGEEEEKARNLLAACEDALWWLDALETKLLLGRSFDGYNERVKLTGMKAQVVRAVNAATSGSETAGEICARVLQEAKAKPVRI